MHDSLIMYPRYWIARHKKKHLLSLSVNPVFFENVENFSEHG